MNYQTGPKPSPVPAPRPPFWFHPLVFLVVTGVYFSTLNPALFRNDSPETITACVTLGISHPPGYPLHTLLGRLFSFLALGNPAMTLNLFSAFLGAVGACLFAANAWLLLRPLAGGKDPSAGGSGMAAVCLLGSFCFAFSKSYWSESLAAKGGIYSLQVVLELGFLFHFQRWSQSAESRKGFAFLRRPYFLAFVFALGLANHWPSLLLLVPAILLGFFTSPHLSPSKSSRRFGAKHGLTCLASMVIVLSLYLYLPLRSHLHPGLDFGSPSSFGRFFSAILRTGYFKRETLASFMPSALSTIQEKSAYISNRFGSEFNVFFSLLSFGGVALLWRRGLRKELLFLLVVLLTTLAANLLYLEVAPIEYWHMDDHLLTVNWVTALLSSAGLYGLWSSFRRIPSAKYLLPAFSALLPVFTYWGNHASNDQTREFLYRGYGMEALKSMDRRATYFAESDYDYFSILYLTEVEHKRPDVRLRLTTFLGPGDWADLRRRVASGSSSAGRPLYCAFPNGPFINGYLQYAKKASFKPSGTLTEFMPPKSSGGIGPSQPLEELWEKYLAPARRTADPINGFLLELCAHPYLNAADYMELRGNLSQWDPFYDRALSLISENPWLADSWARRAEGDLLQGKKKGAVESCLNAAANYLSVGQAARARIVLHKALVLDPSNDGLRKFLSDLRRP